MTNDYEDFLKLLGDFEALPDILKSESIFDIAGYPHYENVCSNILAFYLNPNNEHGLGNLLFSSLMSFDSENEPQHNNFRINREVSTNKGGRLDILIETDNQIIGIENKIFHYLENDLVDYSDSIEELAKPNQLDQVKIILSMKEEAESSGFKCVTYKKLWSKIREQMGSHVSTSSQKWVLYLIDFMSTIEKLYGGNMELDKNDQFFIENEKRVNKLLNARNDFVSKLNEQVKKLRDIIKEPDKYEKQWIYAKTCLVHDFNLSDHSIALDLYLSPQGWELHLLGRDEKSKSYLRKLFSVSPMSEHKVVPEGDRYIFELEEYNLATELGDIKKMLLKWFDYLIESDKNNN